MYFLNLSGRSDCRTEKTFSSRRCIRKVFYLLSRFFKEKTESLFPVLKSQYLQFLKYWLFFIPKMLIFKVAFCLNRKKQHEFLMVNN
jgi:hypothetical protein